MDPGTATNETGLIAAQASDNNAHRRVCRSLPSATRAAIPSARANRLSTTTVVKTVNPPSWLPRLPTRLTAARIHVIAAAPQPHIARTFQPVSSLGSLAELSFGPCTELSDIVMCAPQDCQRSC